MKKVVALLVVLVVLTACDSFDRGPQYYEGTRGVSVDFAEGNPPTELFVRGDEATFNIDVRVRNHGASVTKGGVYLSGYDPTIIDVEGIDEDRDFFQSCRFDIDNIGYGNFNGLLQCERLGLGPLGSVSGGIEVGDGFRIDLDDLNIGTLLDNIFNTDLFTNLGFNQNSVSFDSQGGGSFAVSFDLQDFDPDRVSRGPYFLSLWAPWSFEYNQGTPYTMQGDTPSNPGVKESFVTFNATATLPEESVRTSQPLMVTNCYLYTTYAASETCIDPQPNSDTEKACRLSGYSSGNGQGAPVAITNVQPRYTGQDIVYEITVENVGSGRVYNPKQIDKCSPHHPEPVTEEDLGTIVLGMAYVGDQQLDCVPDQHTLRLYNGRGTVSCALDLESQPFVKSGYTSPLVLEMWYGYADTVRRTVTIRRV